MDMMPSELREYERITHFFTQGFDHIENEKIHTQTLAAMSPMSESY